MKITVDEVVYDVVKEEKIYNSCDGCFMRTVLTIMDDCKGFTGIDCVEEEVITKALENANEVAVQALNEKKKKDDSSGKENAEIN